MNRDVRFAERRRQYFIMLWPPLVTAVFALVVWEGSIRWFNLSNYILPSLGEILVSAANHSPELFIDTVTTVYEALAGYFVGAALGVGLALLFVVFPRVERFALPAWVTINSVPMIAYGPLAVIWFGIGSVSKIVLILIAVSYTVLINALAGLRSCDPGAIALLRSFGASDGTILLKLRMPGAMPAIFSGLRVAVVHAMILAVVLEMLGARAGLGWSVYKSTQMMNFVGAWVAVGASVIVSLFIYGIVNWIGRKFVWW